MLADGIHHLAPPPPNHEPTVGHSISSTKVGGDLSLLPPPPLASHHQSRRFLFSKQPSSLLRWPSIRALDRLGRDLLGKHSFLWKNYLRSEAISATTIFSGSNLQPSDNTPPSTDSIYISYSLLDRFLRYGQLLPRNSSDPFLCIWMVLLRWLSICLNFLYLVNLLQFN